MSATFDTVRRTRVPPRPSAHLEAATPKNRGRCSTLGLKTSSIVLVAAALMLPAVPQRARAEDRLVSPELWSQRQDGAAYPSIQACLDASRPGDTCVVAPGEYHETLAPPDGVTIRSQGEHAAVLTGADRVTSWTRVAPSIFAAEIPPNEAGDDLAIFVDGALVPEASWPPAPSDPFQHQWAIFGPGTDATHLATPGLNGELLMGATIHIWSGANAYTHLSGTLTGGGPDQATVQLESVKCPNLCPAPGGRYFVFGSINLLKRPGDWYFDRPSGRLFVFATGDQFLSRISVRMRRTAIDLRAKRHVTITGIRLFAGTITMDSKSCGNRIEHIDAIYPSTYGILRMPDRMALRRSDGATDIVSAREDDSGLIIDGHNNIISDSSISYSSGNGVRIRGSRNALSRTSIYKTGYMGSYATAVSLSGDNQVVDGNTISYTGRDGITVDYHVAGTELHNDMITGNTISHTGTYAVDSGGIYICCRIDGSGSYISGNYISQNPGAASGRLGFGIYVDNGAYGFRISQNKLRDNGKAAIFIHGDRARTAPNVIDRNDIKPTNPRGIWVGDVDDASSIYIWGNSKTSGVLSTDVLVSPNLTRPPKGWFVAGAKAATEPCE